MNKIEQMHLDVMSSEVYVDFHDYNEPYVQNTVPAAFKSAEITQQIAIEFAKFCLNKAKDLDTHTVYHNTDNVFQEFLKTKQ